MKEERKNLNTFQVIINGGPEETITIKSGQYALAAVAALAMTDQTLCGRDEVVIWCNDLIPEYGPYRYMWNGNTLFTMSYPR